MPSSARIVSRFAGKYPNRGPSFKIFEIIRKEFYPEYFPGTTGVLCEEGEKWHSIRSKVKTEVS